MSRKLTLDQFIERSEKIHNFKYDYSLSHYVNSATKLKIICPIHGVFEQRASNHLHGRGCQVCSSLCFLGKTKSWAERMVEIREKHGDKYLYPDYSNDSIGIFSKIKITCRTHGDFNQILKDHIEGKGCRGCSSGSNFRRSDYIEKCKKCHGGFSNFYVIAIVDLNGVEFLKIGITVQDILQRYSKSVMPYSFKVVKFIRADAGLVFDLEAKLKKALGKYRYSPNLKFGGSRYECFSHISDDAMMLINKLELRSVKTSRKT